MGMKTNATKRAPWTTKKKVWAAARIAVIALVGIAAFLLRPGADKRQPAFILEEGVLEYTVEEDGLVESAHRSEVYAPSGLKVSEVFVQEGGAVRQGDMLAQLDTEALTLEIQRAELNIRSAEANMSSEQAALANSVTSARNALSSAEVALQTARREYETLLRQEGKETAVTAAGINLDAARRAYEYNLSLFDIGGVSQEMLNQAENTWEKAQAAYDDAVSGAGGSLDGAREAFDAAQIRRKTANDALNDAIAKNTDPAAAALELQRVAYQEKLLRLRDAGVTAPSGGTVTLVNAKEGAPASGLLFVIEDERELLVRARVGEADVAALSVGTPCLIRPAGGAQAYDGAVTLLPAAAERDATGAFSAAAGDDVYFIVEAAMENAQPDVYIGMNAKVTFIAGSKDACFAVPNGLIYRDGERRWVVARGSDGRLAEVPVETGVETRRVTEIIAESLYEGMALYNRAE
jgi:multidrug efflux pump subunit AcrA (membrane-fusion protein)